MKSPIAKMTAEMRVVDKYRKLYVPLIDLVNALQNMEAGGTMVENVTFTDRPDEHKLQVAYTTKQVELTIQHKDRTFMLRVIEEPLK